MTYRALSIIIFSLIVLVEISYFLSIPTPTRDIPNGKPRTGLFGGYDTVVDYDQQNSNNGKFAIVVGSTLILGAIVTYNIPKSKIKKEGSSQE